MTYFDPWGGKETFHGGSYRIDQGVDSYLPVGSPVFAPTGGTIYKYSPPPGGFANLGAIYERFDQPITVGGTQYYGAYFSELGSGGYDVTSGPVQAGSVIGHSRSGSTEFGFLVGQDLAIPPLRGGLGAGTQADPSGRDFQRFVQTMTGNVPPSTGSGGGFSGGTGGGGSSGGGKGGGATTPGSGTSPGTDPGGGSSGKCCLESHVGIHAEVPCWFPTAIPCDKITNIIPSIPNPLGVFDSIQQAFAFLFSYRFLEILGGGILVIAGLVVLARNLGIPTGTAGAVAAKAGV